MRRAWHADHDGAHAQAVVLHVETLVQAYVARHGRHAREVARRGERLAVRRVEDAVLRQRSDGVRGRAWSIRELHDPPSRLGGLAVSDHEQRVVEPVSLRCDEPLPDHRERHPHRERREDEDDERRPHTERHYFTSVRAR